MRAMRANSQQEMKDESPSSRRRHGWTRFSRRKIRIPDWIIYLVIALATLTFAMLSYRGYINGVQTEYVTDTLIFVTIYAILSLSLNLEFGFTGLVNFGKASFFLIGAYSVAIPMAYFKSSFSWTGDAVVGAFVFGIFVGIVISAIAGAALSAIGARLREDYFGILTLVFAEIVRRAIYDTSVTSTLQGPNGINGLQSIFPESVYTNVVAYSVYTLLLALVIFGLVYFFGWRMTNSPFGRSMRAIRDDELATQSVGKNTLWYKIQVMMVGSGISSVAGAIYTAWILSANPVFFLPAITFQIYIISIMGGSSSLKGAFLGSVVFFLIARIADLSKGVSFTLNFLQFSFHFGLSQTQAPNLQYIITGALLIIFVILRPQGIIREGVINTGKVST